CGDSTHCGTAPDRHVGALRAVAPPRPPLGRERPLETPWYRFALLRRRSRITRRPENVSGYGITRGNLVTSAGRPDGAHPSYLGHVAITRSVSSALSARDAASSISPRQGPRNPGLSQTR